MNAKNLIAHFDRIIEAPDAGSLLRDFIRQSAVRGGLLDGAPPEPEPLKGSAILQNGYAFKSEWFTPSGVRLLRNANVGHGVVGWQDDARLPATRSQEFERFRLNEGDVVLSLDRPFIATGTKVARIRAQDLPSLLLQRVGRFVLDLDRLTADYLFLWIQSPDFRQQILPGRSNGVPHISSKQVEAALIVRPPVEEQRRIVAKVDELMRLCDQLEEAHQAREKGRGRLATSSQSRTVEATADPETFRASAAFYLERLPRLATRAEHIPELRRTILELAVRGGLGTRSPKEEPVSALLDLIEAERARMVQSGEIRKRKPLPPVTPEEVPYLLPDSWEWVRLRQVTTDRGQGAPTTEFTYIDVGSINKDVGRVESPAILGPADAPSRARKQVRKGDVLYSCVRPYLLNVAIVEEDFDPAPIASTAFAILHGFGLVEARYLWIWLRSPAMVALVEDGMRGQAYPAINDRELGRLPLPLPSLDEQKRIVAKVDELMVVCDQLEDQLRQGSSKRSLLLEAVLHEALTVG